MTHLEALESVKNILDGRFIQEDFFDGSALKAIKDVVTKALDNSEPMRNCDIGTPEEQAKRHEKWCNTTLRDAHEFYDNENECLGCHSKAGDTRYCFSCPFQWMQMRLFEPYVKKEDK